MEVSRDPLREVVYYLETHNELSNVEADEVVKTIFDNSKSLNILDPASLSKIRVKLLQIDSPSIEKKQIINSIDRIFTEYTGKIDHLIKDMENEIYFIQQLGSLKVLKKDEYVRAYQNRFTWAYDLEVKQNYVSTNLFASTLRPFYSMHDKPEDLIKLIYEIKENLEIKINKLLIELKKDGAAVESLEKGLTKLNSLSETFLNAAKGIENLQKSPLYVDIQIFKEEDLNQISKLENFIKDFNNYQKTINDEVVELDRLVLFANDTTGELDALKETYRSTHAQMRNLENNSFNTGDIIREEKFLKNYSHFLSQKSKSTLTHIDGNQLKDISTISQNNLHKISVNGLSLNSSASEIEDFIKKSNLDPKCTAIISDILSAKMFQKLIDDVEIQSKNNSLNPLMDLDKASEILFDDYGNLEIILKMACGYSTSEQDKVDEFFLVKRSFRISKEDLDDILNENQQIGLENFKIVDYISPEVNVSEFKLNGINFNVAIGSLLEQFSPTQNWGQETGKLLFKISKPIPGIDDVKIFKGLVLGEQINLTPIPLSESDRKPNEIGIDYIVPLIVTKDFPRSPLLKLNGEEIYGSFKSGLLTRNEAYAKIAAAFGEDPHHAPLASFACLAISQAVVADFVPKLNRIDEQDRFHIQTWDLSLFEIEISHNNILSIFYKATIYDYLVEDQKVLNSGQIISRKFQMPIAQLSEALKNNNPDLVVDLIAENRLSPPFLIKDKNYKQGDPLKIINTEEHTYMLNNKEAFELLANFK